MTAIGEYGRKPPGESWRLAMARAEQLRAEGSKRRYRIRGRRIAPGWWTYEAVKVSRAVAAPAPRRMPPQPMTKQRIAALAATLPRCAQRGRVEHGGGTKVAWPRRLAWPVANTLGQYAYPCELPAPALGEHWHTSKSRKRRGS
jgi:hypothetical protein